MNVSNQHAQVVSGRARRVTVAASVLLLMQLAAAAQAGPNEQAKRIYERIAGEEPPAATLTQMATAITNSPGQAGLLAAAAKIKGKPLSAIDGLLAATAIHHNLTIVSRNVGDFTNTQAPVVNPWEP